MNKKHIRLGSLVTLSAALVFGPIANVDAASQYKLDNNVKIYMNADNAKRGVSSLGTYSAGNYYIYKKFNGMINVSRVAGQPGAWINPNQVKTSSKTTTVSAPKAGSYTLKSTAKGYSNAADARNKVNQKTTLSKGTYYIYKTYNGMLNLTRTKGTPGSWVNPNTVSAAKVSNTTKNNTTSTRSTKPASGTYSLKYTVNGYTNAALAKANSGSNSTVSAGTYYIYKSYNGMLNLSKKKGVPGSWINPNAKSVVKSKVSSGSSTIIRDITNGSPLIYSLRQLQFNGIVNWSGYKFTYYSQRVLPGRGLRIPGRHVNSAGYVADKDGYIVLANSAPKGTVINTPFGFKGKVYDRGTYGNHFDVYTR
ncbi:hypothetical protein [Helcococcus kunzii]|uniref:hypothetical protein n=1 Tax=Helcococcus kunzii TaxID=40091 RepID=UPI0021A43D96|nr:hypothetical protein [Helcococcus kunzii]MCT1795747.1 hypothetical protein [Helcococcus kunzii]MCT1989572.1 hypothetical protein [Helcococcus kunzii]